MPNRTGVVGSGLVGSKASYRLGERVGLRSLPSILSPGDDVNGTYEGATCEDFNETVRYFQEMTTPELTTVSRPQ